MLCLHKDLYYAASAMCKWRDDDTCPMIVDDSARKSGLTWENSRYPFLDSLATKTMRDSHWQ